jgi:hypothetical protein
MYQQPFSNLRDCQFTVMFLNHVNWEQFLGHVHDSTTQKFNFLQVTPLAEIISETSGQLLMLDTLQPVLLISILCRLVQSTVRMCLLCIREIPTSNPGREICHTEFLFCDPPPSMQLYRIEYNMSCALSNRRIHAIYVLINARSNDRLRKQTLIFPSISGVPDHYYQHTFIFHPTIMQDWNIFHDTFTYDFSALTRAPNSLREVLRPQLVPYIPQITILFPIYLSPSKEISIKSSYALRSSCIQNGHVKCAKSMLVLQHRPH